MALMAARWIDLAGLHRGLRQETPLFRGGKRMMDVGSIEGILVQSFEIQLWVVHQLRGGVCVSSPDMAADGESPTPPASPATRGASKTLASLPQLSAARCLYRIWNSGAGENEVNVQANLFKVIIRQSSSERGQSSREEVIKAVSRLRCSPSPFSLIKFSPSYLVLQLEVEVR